MSQLAELARKFPDRLVKQKPGKFAASYVEHALTVSRLLEVLGPYSYTVDELIRDADGTVSGCLATLTVQVDGRTVSIREVGDVEHPTSNAGSNAKAAASDALKRCAARIGLGLHLWTSGGNYYLDKALEKRDDA